MNNKTTRPYYQNHPLIGKRINLKKSEVTQKLLNQDYTYTIYQVDDPYMVRYINAFFPDFRILLPDDFSTSDYKPNRVNVYINKDGIITDMSNG